MLANLLSPNLEHIVFVAGVALVTVGLMMRLIKRRRNPTPTVTPVEQLERMRQTRGMRGDLEALMVEIEQMAKRLGAQLDVKAMRLEKLVGEADQRIAMLQRMKADGPLADDLRQALREAVDGQAPPAAPLAPQTDDLPDDPLARSVCKLADAGHSSIEIARQLNEHVGKVELILALRQSA